MPDIAMCLGCGCPKKTECYRHTAEPGGRQSWIAFYENKGEEIGKGNCTAFLANEKHKPKVTTLGDLLKKKLSIESEFKIPSPKKRDQIPSSIGRVPAIRMIYEILPKDTRSLAYAKEIMDTNFEGQDQIDPSKLARLIQQLVLNT